MKVINTIRGKESPCIKIMSYRQVSCITAVFMTRTNLQT